MNKPQNDFYFLKLLFDANIATALIAFLSLLALCIILYIAIDIFIQTIFFLMFILVEAPYTDRKIDRTFSSRTGNKVKGIMHKISKQVSYYMINQTLLTLATALCIWLSLAVMKVELARGWTMIWGVPGAFLSVPIASIIRIICENIQPLSPIAVLMGNAELLPQLKGDDEN